MKAAQGVHYTEAGQDHITVERLQENSLTTEVAYDALCIMTAAYTAQFEGPNTRTNFPKGTIERYFQPEDAAAVKRQRARMEQYIEKQGSTYWFARSGMSTMAAHSQRPMGLIKNSPSRASLKQKLRVAPPNLYINDIAVNPDAQRRHIGSSMLHAVTKFGGYDEEATMALDGFVDNEANEWFEALGLRARPQVDLPPLELGEGQALAQLRFTSGPLTLRSIARRLEDRYAHVRYAKRALKA